MNGCLSSTNHITATVSENRETLDHCTLYLKPENRASLLSNLYSCLPVYFSRNISIEDESACNAGFELYVLSANSTQELYKNDVHILL